jgi:hypothetical protein
MDMSHHYWRYELLAIFFAQKKKVGTLHETIPGNQNFVVDPCQRNPGMRKYKFLLGIWTLATHFGS